MYNNDIFIAVREEMEDSIEPVVKLFGQYKKEVNDAGVFFYMQDVDYDDTGLHGPSEAIKGVLSECPPSDYVMIRFGDDVEDTEIHGRIQDFGLKVVREIKYR